MFLQKPEEAREEDVEDDDEEDFEKALKKEVEEIKAQAKSKQRRFQQVDSGAKNVVFIQTSVSPNELFETIISDLYEKKQAKSRHIMRMFPVAGTCKVQTFEEEIGEILEPFFSGPEGHSFYLKIKIRNCNDKAVKNCFDKFIEVIKGLNSENKATYTAYDYVVQIDVIRSVMCVSVLKDFVKYEQYNLQAVCGALEIEKQKQRDKQRHQEAQNKGDGNAEAGEGCSNSEEGNAEKEMEQKSENTEEVKDTKEDISDVSEEKCDTVSNETKDASKDKEEERSNSKDKKL